MQNFLIIFLFISLLPGLGLAEVQRIPGLFSINGNNVRAVDLTTQPAGVYSLGPVYHVHAVDFVLGSAFSGELHQCDVEDADANGDLTIDAAANCLLISNLTSNIFVPANSSRRRFYILKITTPESELNKSTLTIKGTFNQVRWTPEVILLGDSFTEGIVSLSNGTDVSGCPLGNCFAAKLEEALGNNFKVINAGRGGASATDWRPGIVGIPFVGTNLFTDSTPLFDALIAPNLPSHAVVIFLGHNDAVGFFENAPNTPEQYITNIEIIVNALTNNSALVILLNPAQLFSQPQATQTRITGYRTEIQNLCNTNSKVVCGEDMFSVLGPGDFGGSSIHPTAEGHQKIADSLFTTIISLFPEIAT